MRRPLAKVCRVLQQTDLFLPPEKQIVAAHASQKADDFLSSVREFEAFGSRSLESETCSSNAATAVPTFTNPAV